MLPDNTENSQPCSKACKTLIFIVASMIAFSPSVFGGVCSDEAIKAALTDLKKDEPAWQGINVQQQQPLIASGVEGNVETLSKFDLSNSSGSSLVTTHIATAYAPMGFDCVDAAKLKNSLTGKRSAFDFLGIDISASLPAQSATLAQYAKQALLTRDGGILNIYFSLAGRDFLNPAFSSLAPTSPGQRGIDNPRLQTVDRIYAKVTTPNELVGYVTEGVGIRAVKTALVGNGQAGLGTFYIGAGVDGPLLQSRDGYAGDPGSGWMSAEVYGAINRVNSSTLELLFGVPAGSSIFRSVGINMTIGLPGKFSLSTSYAKAYGTYASTNIGEVFTVTFGYNAGGSAPKN